MNIQIIEIPNPNIRYLNFFKNTSNFIDQLQEIEGIKDVKKVQGKFRFEKANIFSWSIIEKFVFERIVSISDFAKNDLKVIRRIVSEVEFQKEFEQEFIELNIELNNLVDLLK